MAENKKSFILYADLIHTVNKMPDDKAGMLLKTILSYVNDEEPEVEDLLVSIAFEPVKQQLKRDLKQWDETRVEKSLSGRIGNLKRWNPDLYARFNSNEITIEAAESIALSRKVSHSDKVQTGAKESIANIAVNDTVNVTVNVNGIKIDNVKRIFLMQGGTEEMAQQFFNKHEATGWVVNGNPIKNLPPLISNYISNWKTNNNGKKNSRTASDFARPGTVLSPI